MVAGETMDARYEPGNAKRCWGQSEEEKEELGRKWGGGVGEAAGQVIYGLSILLRDRGTPAGRPVTCVREEREVETN